jgi:hypothetical protein
MGVMLRTLGIPSRLVGGFAGGVENPLTGMHIVRSSDAHAWVDAYIPGYGWLEFDPSPRKPAPVGGRLSQLWMYWDALQVDYHGPRTVAYFRTSPNVAIGGNAVLHLSTADDLAVWVNGRFHWFVPRGNAAWFDFATNPQHRGQRIPVDLQSGPNDIVIRVRGGVYATGGFFARLE